MRTNSRYLLFGLVILILTTFVASSFAHRVPSMAPRKPINVRERNTGAILTPLIIVIDDDCQVHFVARFKFKLAENRGKEDKFWAGRPIRIVNKSGKVVVIRFGDGAAGRRAWSPIGRSVLRMNPGEVYRTRLRSGKSEGETEFVVVCYGERPGEEKSESDSKGGWEGPPRDPPEDPPFEEGGG